MAQAMDTLSRPVARTISSRSRQIGVDVTAPSSERSWAASAAPLAVVQDKQDAHAVGPPQGRTGRRQPRSPSGQLSWRRNSWVRSRVSRVWQCRRTMGSALPPRTALASNPQVAVR